MLVGLTNVTFEFGARIIVEDATWHIHPNERIGLIGYNGTGKSTLLKVLVGDYKPSAGTVEKSRGTSIGYLHQDLLSFDTSDSILQVAMGAFGPILALEKEIETLGKALEENPDEDKLLVYTDKLHELEVLGGYTIHHKTEEVLQGLGFAPADLQRPYRQFSGGWRMRVLLAKMILQQPDLLLLDEPTNHLDLPSIEWLEKYLQHYQGTVIIVSHDKFFLDRMVTKVVELYQQQLHFYTGNYSFYQKEKEQRVALQQRAYENQQDYIRQQERFIERFKAKASKATQAQSIVKRLERLDRIENVEIERPNIRINFSIDKTPGKIICALHDISKSFGALKIVEHTAAEIDRGDKIALIGANGKGKSTLLRIIAGTESHEGERVWGHNIQESFYAQHQLEDLDLNASILEEMKTCGSGKTEQELRTLLGCFLFSGEDTDKRIKVLSGGEKARVALAKVIASKANFLLLDEPTNHLDMHSVDLLIEALQQYQGSLIMVSHDRHFIAQTANKIWEIVDGKIISFKGPYSEWLVWKERKQKWEKEQQNLTTETIVTQVAPPPVQKTQQLDRDKKKEQQKVQRQFQQAEEKLAQLNREKEQLELAMADPEMYANKQQFQETERAYQQIQFKLKEAEEHYESLFEKLMDFEA